MTSEPDPSSLDRRMLVVTPTDLSNVQGSTEAYYLLRELSGRYRVELIAGGDPEFDGTSFTRIPESRSVPALVWYNLFLLPFFFYRIFAFDPDVVYTYKGICTFPWLTSRFLRRRWFADFQTAPTAQGREFDLLDGPMSTLRNAYYDVYDILYRQTLPAAEAVVTLSDQLVSELVRDYGVPKDRIVLVPLGVDTDKFDPSRYGDIRDDGEPLRCVYVGSLWAHRGVDVAIRALSVDSAIAETYEFHVVGGTNGQIERIQRLADEYGVSDNVHLHGYVPHDDVPGLLARMDVGLSPLPNLEAFEVSSPAKLYEYLAMGLPVICTDIEAHRRVLTDGETGFYFPPDDPEGMVEQLRRFATLPEHDRETLASRAREEASKHDWNNRIKRILGEIGFQSDSQC